jgi:hypothetical protein
MAKRRWPGARKSGIRVLEAVSRTAMTMQIPAWTDSPMSQLGDRDQRAGPIRAVTIIRYDGGDSADVRCGAEIVSVKATRLYPRPRPRVTPSGTNAPTTKTIRFLSIVEDSAYMRIKRAAWLLLNPEGDLR